MTAVVTGGSVVGAVVTTGAPAEDVAAEVVTAMVTGGMAGPVGVREQFSSLTIAPYMRSLNSSASCISASTSSSSVRSNISESNFVRVLSFSSRLSLSCAKWAGAGSPSASRVSVLFVVRVAELLWPPLIFCLRAKAAARAAAAASASVVIVYFRLRVLVQWRLIF